LIPKLENYLICLLQIITREPEMLESWSKAQQKTQILA